MATAAQCVLGLPECLEMILHDLDQSTLLTSAQRVCKSWHSTIAESQRIQRKLFFAPDGKTRGCRIHNPILEATFGAFLNTNLNTLVPQKHVLKLLGNNPAAREPLLREGASWRRMFPEYPVTHKIGFIEARHMGQRSYYSGVLDVPGGVRMGKLFDVAYTMNLGRNFDESTFGVYWREKRGDPQVTDWSWKIGTHETALSKMVEDVKIVICPWVADSGHNTEPGSIKVLSKTYMPKNFEFCTVPLKFASAQDWFG